jgi:prepilin-type N-terminal cleavage/methylation domain-containing protein
VKLSRGGMTLFELLIVMIVVGIVYSMGMFTLKKERVISSNLSLTTLKSSMKALEHSSEIRMVCDKPCQECRVFSTDKKLVTTFHLQAEAIPIRYGFDRYGELKPLGSIVTRSGGVLQQGCFELSLYPDGTFTPLILKSKFTFYAYTPLGGDKPFVTQNEDALRRFLFNEVTTPLKTDSYYGTH